MEVNEIMTENPICCLPDAGLEEVARLMAENDCGAIPVVADEEGWKPIGIVTDRDITCRAVAEGKNPLEMTAEEVMTGAPVCIRQDADLEECIREMETHRLRRILVTDDTGGCVGIISLADLALHAGGPETAEVVGEVSRPIGEG